jgi:small subunit ribosomal protein S18
MSEDRNQRAPSKTGAEDNKKVFFKRRKGCPLSGPGAPEITYKNPALLAKFISEGGRILPSRVTNVSAPKQRLLKTRNWNC